MIFAKNEGRANATSTKTQALKEMDAVVKKQYDKGYTKPGEKSYVLPLPMLAKKFSDLKKSVELPVWVQPKYNGMRMLYDGTKGLSRGGKDIIPEVIQHLKIDTHGHILDGELILPNSQFFKKRCRRPRNFTKASLTLSFT